MGLRSGHAGWVLALHPSMSAAAGLPRSSSHPSPPPNVQASAAPRLLWELPRQVETLGWALARPSSCRGPGRQGCAGASGVREQPSRQGSPRGGHGLAPHTELLGWSAVGGQQAHGPGARTCSKPRPRVGLPAGQVPCWLHLLAGTSRGVWGPGLTPSSLVLVTVVRLSVGYAIKTCHCPTLPFLRGLRESSLWVSGHFFATLHSHESLLWGAQPAADPDLHRAGLGRAAQRAAL